ncbi:MAG: hypothetical protein AB9882_05180 [Ignavibacteriaceae bacterium]
MSKELFEKLSYGAIGVVALLLLLMIGKIVPEYVNPYFLGMSIALLVVRFAGRAYFLVKDAKKKVTK